VNSKLKHNVIRVGGVLEIEQLKVPFVHGREEGEVLAIDGMVEVGQMNDGGVRGMRKAGRESGGGLMR
jgi:hypothetical protein